MLLRLRFLSMIFWNFIFKFIPIKNKYVYFISYHGQYNDNPKYISEALHEIDSEIVCIWEINKKSNEGTFPKYVKKVKPYTVKAYFYKNLSKVVIDNYTGYYSGYLNNTDKIKKMIFLNMKNKKQKNISTWHGSPIKKIALDEPGFGLYEDFISTSDGLLVGNEYTYKILNRICCGKIPILKLGTPRNDLLIKNDLKLKNKLKNKLKLPQNKKVILFAPTFRNDVYKSGLMQLEQFNFIELFKVLNEKFGGEWIFVYRFHDKVLNAVDFNNIQQKSGATLFNGNLHDDMAEYLYVSDMLITDYSSSIFDYALTNKPCFLFCPDIEFYESIERGFYVDIKSLPNPFATSFDEFISNITLFSQEKYDNDIKKFMEYMGDFEDGSASQRVANMIYEYIQK